MYVSDHKPALALAATSVGTAVTHAAVKLQEHAVTTFDSVDKWVHLLGGVVGVLAGLASFCWYVYSFIKARKQKSALDQLGGS